ncbi:MAG: hypothetical protein IMZ50_04345, partial [Candidatus Atribacteria bacterium]|nr:hypothetical protein [Candidatus Atribacteria bacterium]
RKDLGAFTSETRIWETPRGELTERLEIPNDPKMRENNPDEYGLVKEFLIKEEKDLEALPYCFREPEAIDVAECDAIRRAVGENAVIEAFAPDALHNAVVSFGLEQIMVEIFNRPEWVREILGVFQKAALRRTEIVLDRLAQADIVFTTGCYTTESIWSPKHWEAWFAPLVAEQTKLIREGGKVHNYFVDGKMMGHLRKVKEMGIGILSSLEPPQTADGDLRVAKQMVGDVVCLWGNIDPIYVLQMGNQAKIEAAVQEAIQAAAAGGGFILGTGEVISRQTPPSNLRAFVEAGKRFGRYGVAGAVDR